MKNQIVSGLVACAVALALAGCASPQLTTGDTNPQPSSHLTLRLDMTSGHPKVYVSRVDLEAALGKKLTDDNAISPFDALGWLVCSQNPPDATGKLFGKGFASILPTNDKPGSGYLLVFDSANKDQLGECAYVAVTLRVYGAKGQQTPSSSATVLVKMPK